MDCIYLYKMRPKGICYCHAQPVRSMEAVVWYLPTDKEVKAFCTNSEKFSSCPRFKAFQDHQKIALIKSE